MSVRAARKRACWDSILRFFKSHMSLNTVNARNGLSNGPRNQMAKEERLAAVLSFIFWVLLHNTHSAPHFYVWHIIYPPRHWLPNCLSPEHWGNLRSKCWT